MRIIPAILTNNIEDFNKQIDNICEFTDEVDIDILDGVFSAEKTIPIKDIDTKHAITFNFDLMVKEPGKYFEDIIALKKKGLSIGRVFVHIESEYDVQVLFEKSKDNFILGFSSLMQTATESIIDLQKKFKKLSEKPFPVLLKTVQIGKQGNPYHPEVLGKVSKLRRAGFDGEIYLDGGIDPDIIMTFRNYDIAGVSVGSYISHSSDPFRAFSNLRDATWKQKLD